MRLYLSSCSQAACPWALSRAPSAQAGVCCACGSDSLKWVTGIRKDNGKSFAALHYCLEDGFFLALTGY